MGKFRTSISGKCCENAVVENQKGCCAVFHYCPTNDEAGISSFITLDGDAIDPIGKVSKNIFLSFRSDYSKMRPALDSSVLSDKN